MASDKILTLDGIRKLKSLKGSKVLTGGCFDILHFGHVEFFKKAKKGHKVHIVLLESDRKVMELKGEKRPLFNQDERALMLSELSSIDFVVKLPYLDSDNTYQTIVTDICPDTVAITKGDPLTAIKKTQAEKIGARLMEIGLIKEFSSSLIAKKLGL